MTDENKTPQYLKDHTYDKYVEWVVHNDGTNATTHSVVVWWNMYHCRDTIDPSYRFGSCLDIVFYGRCSDKDTLKYILRRVLPPLVKVCYENLIDIKTSPEPKPKVTYTEEKEEEWCKFDQWKKSRGVNELSLISDHFNSLVDWWRHSHPEDNIIIGFTSNNPYGGDIKVSGECSDINLLRYIVWRMSLRIPEIITIEVCYENLKDTRLPPTPKPPLGLAPEYLYIDIVNKERLLNICDAMKRYVEGDKIIPEKWINELKRRNELVE